MARKNKGNGAAPPLPPLGEVVRGRFGGAIEGPYERWVDGKHLGPYSPRHVPIRTLKFMREHPQLGLGLAAYRGPFFGIDFDVIQGTPKTRAFIRKVLLDTPLMARVLETILNALDYGFQAHEIIYDLADVTFDDDGKSGTPPTTLSLAAVIADVNDIEPQRVTPIVDDRDKLIGYKIDGWSLDTVPIEKALHAVHSMEHRNWRGRSLLRRSYKPWYWAEFIALFMTRWYERKSDPPYHGEAPPEPRKDPKTGQDVWPTQVLKQQLLDLRTSGVIVTPREPDKDGKPKWSIRELTDGGRAGEFVTGLAYLDALMLRGLLVPEEITTRGSVGSQAKTETVYGVFLQALEYAKKTLVLRTIQEGLINPLVRWNFANEAPPIITAPEFNRESKELLADIYKLALMIPQQLENGQYWRPIDALNVERLQGLLNIPHRKPEDVARSLEEIRAEQEAEAAKPPPAGSPQGQNQAVSATTLHVSVVRS